MRLLTLSHLTVIEVGPPDLIDLAAEAGFKAVGVRLSSPMPGGVEYPLRPGGQAMIETRRRMRDLGVEVFDVEVVRIAADTDVETYVPMFAAAAELGAQRVCVNIDDPDRARTIDRFAKLCDLAAPAGLSLDVEFMIWRPVARLEDAVAVVRGAGKRNGGVLVDALHLHRSGGSAADVAALDPALIGSFQLCDARGKAPDPSEIINEARTDRLPPGEGELPLRELIDALPPGMPFSLEIPMTRSAPELSPVARARRIYRAARAFLSKCA